MSSSWNIDVNYDSFELAYLKDLLIGEIYHQNGKLFRVTQILPGFYTNHSAQRHGFFGMFKTVIVEFEDGSKGMIESKGSYETEPYGHYLG